MRRKIMGVTVDTPISPRKIDETLKPVKSVNGVMPGEDGDVSIVVGTFDQEGKAADSKATGDRFALIEKDIADLLYKAISITTFATSAVTAELGSTVNDVTLTWKLNKKPVSVTIDGVAQEAVADGSLSMTGLGLKATKKWTLKATDERGTVATKETSLSFHNGVYYGVGGAQSSYTSLFILGLTKTLRSTKLASFTANAGEGQYIYYCLPTRMGTCTFTVGGFEGGFDLVSTLNFENASGYKENYYIYRSTNAGLGNTTVGVT